MKYLIIGGVAGGATAAAWQLTWSVPTMQMSTCLCEVGAP